MTERTYLTSPALTGEADVLDCLPRDDGRYAVRLNATLFHPQGGGQPSDSGWINQAAVLHVAVEDGGIIHLTAGPVALGKALMRVDGERRQLHSRLHSAGHLIGHVLELARWRPIKAHHWPGEGRIQFKPDGDAPNLTAEEIQTRCERYLAQDLPCRATLNDDGFREVGFGRFAPYPCGGTHVASLGRIGGIRVLAVQMKKGNLTVHYDVA